MAAQLIDGRELAKRLRETVGRRVAVLRAKGRPVRLDAVLVDHDGTASARLYAHNQAKMCDRLGIEYRLHELPASAKFDDVAGRVLLLNNDHDAHAVMVHLPLPDAVDTYRVQSLIAPEKDVEGVNPANIGNIVYGRVSLAPCTASAVIKLIDSTGVDVRGKFCVCVGASDIVGKPAAVMLMRREATVVSCNKYTSGITELTRQADVLISAAGVAGLVKPDWVKPGSVVIDVGINQITGADGQERTVGDVDFEGVSGVAGWITPVPGGVGPVTVAVLLENVVDAAERARLLPR
ncbi:MAG: bifunctional 5,10-methylenetetrahydrofolate dehydrogenase/5,10-methenyltetrahydrofolate cyclohydrolase [Phycisphaerales bacterium]